MTTALSFSYRTARFRAFANPPPTNGGPRMTKVINVRTDRHAEHFRPLSAGDKSSKGDADSQWEFGLAVDRGEHPAGRGGDENRRTVNPGRHFGLTRQAI